MQGASAGSEHTLPGTPIPPVSSPADDARRDSNSSGSKGSDGRAQRRFISPFALAAAPIGTEDDTDSDSRSASLPTQKCPSLTPTSSMTQPPSTGVRPYGQVCQYTIAYLDQNDAHEQSLGQSDGSLPGPEQTSNQSMNQTMRLGSTAKVFQH